MRKGDYGQCDHRRPCLSSGSGGEPQQSQKHVWRANIILLTADGLGTNAIMRGTGRAKSVVWRWQEQFMREGVGGLLRDIPEREFLGALIEWIEGGCPPLRISVKYHGEPGTQPIGGR
jgi:hypothetical protein